MASDVPEEAVQAALEVWQTHSASGFVGSPRQHVEAILAAAAPHIRSGEFGRVLTDFRDFLRDKPRDSFDERLASYLRGTPGGGGE